MHEVLPRHQTPREHRRHPRMADDDVGRRGHPVAHGSRRRRDMDDLVMKRLRPIALRLWPKVAKVGHGTCWIWMGYRNKRGYGEIGRGRRGMGNAAVHVVAYEDLVGPVPDGLTLDHFRMNPGPRHAPCSRACVNPAHLEPVTFRENI